MSISSLSSLLSQRALEWIQWDPNEETKQEIKQILERNDLSELNLRFGTTIAFGTAGLRGAMKAGSAYMNDLTVIQASQGLCDYLLQTDKNIFSKGIAVGYDARHNSQRYAQRTAVTFLHKNIPVYLFTTFVPTPVLAYTVRKLGCSAGVMVTASHNPKDDNGYKVYWGNGAQIISPVDQEIARAISNNLKPWGLGLDILESKKNNNNTRLLRDPSDMIQHYLSDIYEWSFFSDQNKQRKLKITYTAMHGVGALLSSLAFQKFNLSPYFPTSLQHLPDPDFPTVAFPNPEEGKGAMKLAMETANKSGSNIIIANDPDADRMAAAERKPDGTWHLFSGDEVGILLASWLYTNYSKKHPNVKPEKLVVLNTTVSCKALEAFAKRHRLFYQETLTGFKWLGNLAEQLEKQGYTFLFAYEEAIGYMIGSKCLDKDGISAGAVFAEMSSALYAQKSTVLSYLDKIYSEIGYFVTQNSYFFCYDPKVTLNIFNEIRNNRNYPTKCGDFSIKSIRDLKDEGYDSTRADKKPILPTSCSSDNLTFTFVNGAIITLRGSGTEPKLKYYAQLSGPSRETTKSVLQQMVMQVIHNFLQPEKNNLKSPTTTTEEVVIKSNL